MFKRYWRIVLLVAGIAVIGGGSYTGYNLLRAIEEANTTQQSYQPAREARLPKATNNSETSPQRYEPKCSAPENREDADLCAQWAMVGATDQSNSLAASQLWLTFFEIVALIITISFTAWAAFAASAASKAAEASVSLFQTAESGFLVPKIVQNSQDVVTVSLRNMGRTGVVILIADLCASDAPPQGPINLVLSDTDYATNALIGADSSYVFGGGAQQIGHDSLIAFIYGAAIYRTAFGRVRLARIAVSLNRASGEIAVLERADFSLWEAQMRKSFGKQVELD
ncbi:hypothetical protein [Aurantiacibacter zhengii]|uniref:Uncharacterized protein n=1 Tax=Aurantiacibacter zhengii TaxID=2307003 RepID=A0A418NNY9_9SPHN|nr:hypothetical protein [Aurantiacibacter zhengii]RIV83371.1 hypothetical protein D2V07_16610 [Aurantiacibacter zhengii]